MRIYWLPAIFIAHASLHAQPQRFIWSQPLACFCPVCDHSTMVVRLFVFEDADKPREKADKLIARH